MRVVHRERVPLLAGHLAGLAADADRGVGEEPDPRRVVVLVAGLARHVGQRPEQPVAAGSRPVKAGLAELIVVMPRPLVASCPSQASIPRRRRASTGSRPLTPDPPGLHPGPPAVGLDELQQLRARADAVPGTMSAVLTLSSWMWVFGSSTMPSRSLAESPVEMPA